MNLFDLNVTISAISFRLKFNESLFRPSYRR